MSAARRFKTVIANEALLADRALTASALLVGLTVSQKTGPSGAVQKSLPEIADLARRGRTVVREALDELCDRGFLVRRRESNDATVYQWTGKAYADPRRCPRGRRGGRR